MTDDDLLPRLRHDLDDFVGEPGPAPMLATPHTPARPAWAVLAAAAAVIALVAGGLVVLTRNRGDDRVTPLGPEIVSVGKPVPPTPAGWTVVEWGDVRLSLPPDLEPYGPGCTSEAGDEVTVVLTCGDRVLTVVSGGAGEPDPDLPMTVRNGLPTVLVPTPDLEETSSQLLIGEPTSLVRFTGFEADEIEAISDTVGVSSVWRARLEPAPPVPDGWQTVELPGVSFRVPPNWGVSTVGETDLDRDVCGFSGVMDRNVLIGRGSLDDTTVNCIGEHALVPAVDGVRVFPLDDTPGPLGNPFFEIAIDSVGPPQVVRVGLAGDGTIGRTIVGSVVAPGSAVPTAPVTTLPTASPAAPALPVPPTPVGWAVVEWGDVRFSLPPTLDVYGPGCDASGEAGILVLTCGEQIVTVIPGAGSAEPDPPAAIELNGLTVLRTENRCPGACGPDVKENTEFLLFDLVGALVRFTGFGPAEVDEIAATIGVSSKWRASNEPPPPVPDDWRSIGFDNVDIRIPVDWPSITLTPSDVDPDACGFTGLEPAAVFERGGAVVSCAGDPPVLAPPTDGIRIWELNPGASVSSSPGFPYVEQSFEVVGERRTYVVRIGFGVDATIGRTILGSLRITAAPGGVQPPGTTIDATVYETVATVIDDGAGSPQLCAYGVDDSYPPGCQGIDLVGFSWAGLTPEGSQGATTWGAVYVRGTYEPTSNTFDVIETLSASDGVERMGSGRQVDALDHSTPCPEPVGGWPRSVDSAFPAPEISARDEFAGTWIDATNSVHTVKAVGDVAAFETFVRSLYSGPLCVVPAQRTMTELMAVQQTLLAMSSVRVLDTFVLVDAQGERVLATVLLDDPALQPRLDEEFGPGTVVVTPRLFRAG